MATVAGWDAVVLFNDVLRVTVLPEKGADIIELRHVPSGIDVLFKAPWGLRPPGAPPREEAEGLEFIGNYEGGWQELFPNANDACSYEGVELPFHGEVALLPWQAEVLDGGAVRLSVRCSAAAADARAGDAHRARPGGARRRGHCHERG